MLPANRFMKDDRVEFDVNSRTVHGILVEEDGSLKVVADGGRMKFTVPFDRLRFSSKALPRNPPHPMDAWQVVNYRELRDVSAETTAYSATISYDGTAVISISNAGHGAPDRLAPLGGDYGVVLEFKSALREWLADHGVAEGEMADEEAFWVSYRVNLAPYGVLAQDAIDEHLADQPPSDCESLETSAQVRM